MSSSASSTAMPAYAVPENLYHWFNSLDGRSVPVTAEEVREMWTDDCQMITNGQVKCSGIPAFVKHFNEIRNKLQTWKVALPLAIRVEQNNTVGVSYHIDVVMKDGAPGRVLICAFFELRGGKAVKMTEVAHFEGAELHLENH
jgi:SnoaL-like domain